MSGVLSSVGPATHPYELIRRREVAGWESFTIGLDIADVGHSIGGVDLAISGADDEGPYSDSVELSPDQARQLAYALLDHADECELARQTATRNNIQAFLDGLAPSTSPITN